MPYLGKRKMQELQDTMDNIQQAVTSSRRGLHKDIDFFRGRTGENFSLWLDRFNRNAQAWSWTADDKRAVLPSYLRDAAETVFNGIPLEERELMTFDEIVTLLRTRFNPAHASEIKSSELHNRRQRIGEPVLDFSVCIQQLANDVYYDLDYNVRNQLMRRFFVGGLLPDVWRVVISTNPATFEDAELAARNAEAQLQLFNSRTDQPFYRPPASQPFPPQNFFSVNRQRPRVSNSYNKAYIGTRRQPSFDRTPDGKPICFNCGIAGHIAARCRKPARSFQNRQPQQSRFTFRSNTNRPNQFTSRPFPTRPIISAVDIPDRHYSDPIVSVLREQNENLKRQVQSLTNMMNMASIENNPSSSSLQTQQHNPVYSTFQKLPSVPSPFSLAQKFTTKLPKFKTTMLFVFLSFVVRIPAVLTTSHQSYQTCGVSHIGLTYNVPQDIKCVAPERGTIITDTVQLFLPNQDPNLIPAWKCSARKRTICTNVGLVFSRGIVSDTETQVKISQPECRSIVAFKIWREINLVKVHDNLYHSNLTLHPDYMYCCRDVCSNSNLRNHPKPQHFDKGRHWYF